MTMPCPSSTGFMLRSKSNTGFFSAPSLFSSASFDTNASNPSLSLPLASTSTSTSTISIPSFRSDCISLGQESFGFFFTRLSESADSGGEKQVDEGCLLVIMILERVTIEQSTEVGEGNFVGFIAIEDTFEAIKERLNGH
ncbi:hypothetical protein ACB098_01G089600 [Castanea mollissima]